ncbi:cation transporter isoform X1 [Octopus vulgaris]|uniref:Cation transporter isoform X1 n=1 Tax=Octopus vulgaris TaxID=6645 RepID=A0AA36B9D4_OCTVU|nr:cation transporter isoform X1 [Octopus vulgaris]
MAGTEAVYDLDNLLINLKTYGNYQIRQLLVSSSLLIVSHSLFQVLAIGYTPEHQCKDLSEEQLSIYNVTSYDDISYEKCHINIFRGLKNITDELSCINGHNYSANKDISFVIEWNLVCDKDGLAELTQSLFTAGQGAGALIFTAFADKIGRKPVHVGCTFFLMLCASGSALSPNIWVFAALRFLGGAFQQGSALPGFTMVLELFPADKRTLMSLIVGVWWGICVMILALVAYVMKHSEWRWLCAVFGIPGIVCVFEFWYLRESIRWLFAKGKIVEAERIVKRAAKLNGVDFEATWTKCLKSNESAMEMHRLGEQSKELIDRNGTNPEDEAEVHPKETALGLWTMMKYSTTRNITLVIMFAWLITSVTYFGLYLTSSSLSGDRHLNYFLTASMELPSSFLLYKLFMLFGRKKAIIILIAASAVTLLAVAVLKSIGDSDAINTSTIVFSLLGMLAISGAFGGLWLYTPEIYPTTLRTAGMGVASATARIGSVISPYTRMLAARVVWGPGLVFGAGCFIASSLFFILPETHNKQLPQNLDEMLSFKRERGKGEGGKKRKNINSKNNEEI